MGSFFNDTCILMGHSVSIWRGTKH